MSFFGVGELDLMRLPTDGARRSAIGANPLREEGEPAAHHAAPRSPQGGVEGLDRGWRDVALFEIGKVFHPASVLDLFFPISPTIWPSSPWASGAARGSSGPARCRRPRGDRAGEAAG